MRRSSDENWVEIPFALARLSAGEAEIFAHRERRSKCEIQPAPLLPKDSGCCGRPAPLGTRHCLRTAVPTNFPSRELCGRWYF